MTRVEVEIEELVLHGFESLDGPAVAASVERALRLRLARAGGDFGRSRAVGRIDAPAVHLAAGVTPDAVGRAVAERLNGSVRR